MFDFSNSQVNGSVIPSLWPCSFPFRYREVCPLSEFRFVKLMKTWVQDPVAKGGLVTGTNWLKNSLSSLSDSVVSFFQEVLSPIIPSLKSRGFSLVKSTQIEASL